MLAAVLPLVTLLACGAPDVATTTLLTDVVSTSLSHDARVEVITADELQRMVELEAERQMAGCSGGSCMAEIAGAAGARFVVFGNIGALGDELVLTLQLFDSSTAITSGREVVRGENANALADAAPDAVKGLLAGLPVTEGRARLLVLGLKSLGVDDAAPAEAGSLAVPITVIGGVVVAAGLAAVAGSFAFDAAGDDAANDADANAAYDARDGFFVGGLVGAGVGLVVVAVGGVLWAND